VEKQSQTAINGITWKRGPWLTASVRRRHHRCTEVSMCCTELRTNSSSTVNVNKFISQHHNLKILVMFKLCIEGPIPLIPNFAAPPSMQLQPLWLPQFSAISAPLFLHSTHASVRRSPECDCTSLVALGVLRRLHPSETGRHLSTIHRNNMKAKFRISNINDVPAR